MIDKAREVALKILYKVNENRAYSNIVLDEELKNIRKSAKIVNSEKQKDNLNYINNKDIGLISEIVYGVTTWKLTLDEIIKKYSNIRLKKISPWILNILRMGVYQIVFLDKIPKSAAVNEEVELAKKYGHKASSNFVNAVLRKVEKTDFEELKKIENPIERISKTTSMPVWIVEKLEADFKENGESNYIEMVEEVCKYSNYRPKMCIRVNNLKIGKEELIEKLKNKNIDVKEGLIDDFLVLNKVKNLENLEEFKNGYFTVQDEATGLIPIILNPKENEKILDCCSSPGGKTTYMAELMRNKGYIEAWDIHTQRVKLVENNAKRLGINIINAKTNDATNAGLQNEKFDKILLDVPCLGLGVLKRKPDIKWQREEKDIKEISNLQLKILEHCSNFLKSGGELLYSTCSILKEENEDVIKNFLSKNKKFEIKKIKKLKWDFFNKYIKEQGYMQVFPNEKTDGFFICKMTKK